MLLVDHQLKKVLPSLVSPLREDLIGPNSLDVLLSPTFKRLVSEKYNFVAPNAHIRDPKNEPKDMDWKTLNTQSIILEPNEFILASTVESFNIPTNMYAIVSGKSTLAREGIMVECAGFVDSGFSGHITLEIKNLLPYRYRLHAGQLIAQLTFFGCSEVDSDYSNGKHSYQNQQNVTSARNFSNLYKYCDEVKDTLIKNDK